MTKTLSSLAALLLIASPAFANITVSGQGKIKYTPNLAYITVTAGSDGATAQEAWHKNSEIVQKMFLALKEFGIDEKDFKTAGVHVNPRYEYPKEKTPILIGYTVTYDLTVTVRDLKKVGKLLDKLVEAGANSGMRVSFGMDNPEELMDQARLAAVTDARKKAELYVKGAGGSLGGVVSISEGQLNHYREFEYKHMAASPGGSDSSLPIAAGQQELQVTVTVTYTINNHLGSRP